MSRCSFFFFFLSVADRCFSFKLFECASSVSTYATESRQIPLLAVNAAAEDFFSKATGNLYYLSHVAVAFFVANRLREASFMRNVNKLGASG